MTNIEGQVRRAVEDYNMIEDGDKIAIALSGGKDSAAMCCAISNLRRYYPKKFDCIALAINTGFEGFDEEVLKEQARIAGVELIIVPSNIKQIVFDVRNEDNPCSLCANLRRGMLNSIAKEHGCNKVALGHNEDDVLETFLMNFTYGGRIDTLSPVSYMDRSDMTIIRPMIYTTEKSNKSFIKEKQIPTMPIVCPVDKKTTREFMYNKIKEFEISNKQARANMMGAIKRSKVSGWHE